MKKEIIITRDGSSSLAIPELQVTYHSLHGSVQESQHVFIDAGLHAFPSQQPSPLRILEMGLGTGLNALLTYKEAEQTRRMIHYTAIESNPVIMAEAQAMNYCDFLHQPELQPAFMHIHSSEWSRPVQLGNYFTLEKIEVSLQNASFHSRFNLIYYDAFAPSAQPELWTEPIFKKLYDAAEPGAILVTYCSKSIVQRAMKSAGWQIEKIPGPWGKREMIRAKRSVEC